MKQGQSHCKHFNSEPMACKECRAEETTEPKSSWRLHNHIVGKAYDLTQANMNIMIKAIEDLLKENKQLHSHISQMSCCCSGCTKHNDKLSEENNGLDL